LSYDRIKTIIHKIV